MFKPKQTARKMVLVGAETTTGLGALLLILRRFIPELEGIPLAPLIGAVSFVVSSLHGIVDWLRHGR